MINSSHNNLSIVFLCLDGEYAGVIQKPVYEKCSAVIKGSIISNTYYGKQGFVKTALLILRKSGLRYMFSMAYMKLVKARKTKSFLSPSILARKHKIPSYVTSDVNSIETLNIIRDLNPDLVIATNFNQIVGRKVRSLPKLGIVNMHKALLPKHRGMAPSFFALLNEDEYTGVTLHIMKKGIDTGNILGQKKIRIDTDSTVSSLNREAAELGGEILVEFIQEIIDTGNFPVGKQQNEDDADANSFPTRAEVKEFYKKRLRFY